MRYWTSDLHLGHANIIKYCDRPWRTVGDMNAGIIQNFQDILTDQDELWILGDIAMGKFKETLPLLDLVPGSKHLVAGNHDPWWFGHKKGQANAVEFARNYGLIEPEQGNAFIYPHEFSSERHFVRYSHFPYVDDMLNARGPGDTDKFAKRRPKYIKQFPWLIHGHVHGMWKVQDTQINVGVDVWDYKPVSDEQILEIINSNSK